MHSKIEAFYLQNGEPLPPRSEVPAAWDSIVAGALHELHALGIHVTQFKEKWGELKIYTSPRTLHPTARSVVDAAAGQADRICVRCGAQASARDGVYRVCSSHARS
jgi:hypothetical protein